MRYVVKFILGFIFLFGLNISSSALQLSEKAEVSILTCAPGIEVYSVYGHSAIRFNDSESGQDLVFHYGLFDFSAPNFIYRFASGQTDYMVGAYRYDQFIKEFQRDKRRVTEQILDLTPGEKQQMLDYLIWNVRPENKKYRYNFFFDNCATRLRDVVVDHTDGEIDFKEDAGSGKTLRRLVKDYHGDLLWVTFGIDLVVSAPSDEVATDYEEMFLPDYLMAHLGTAKKKDGTLLVKETKVLVPAEDLIIKANWWASPFFVFLILTGLVLFLTVREYKKKITSRWLDYLVFGLTGFIGVVLVWFATVSEHPAMAPNYNLLWAVPLNFLFIVLLPVKKLVPVLRFYPIVLGMYMLLFLIFAWAIPQVYHPVFYLITILVIIRSVLYFKRYMQDRKI